MLDLSPVWHFAKQSNLHFNEVFVKNIYMKSTTTTTSGQETRIFLKRRTNALQAILALALIVAASFHCGGCVSTDGNKIDTRTLTDLFIHFKKCGLHPQRQYPVQYQAVLASNGVVSVIDGAQVEIYVYDQTKNLPKEKLARIEKNKVIKILAVPVPAIVNGHFVMLTYSKSPNIGKIIEAFNSF